jgi:hypothetical protein
MMDKVFAEPPMELKAWLTEMVGEKLASLEELLLVEVVSSLEEFGRSTVCPSAEES